MKSKFIVCYTSILFIFFSGLPLHFINHPLKEKFFNFQKDSESLVIGKILTPIKTSSFPGWYLIENDSVKATVFKQYDYYFNETDLKTVNYDRYYLYQSQIGGQAIVFSALDYISPFLKKTNYLIFRNFTCLLNSLIFSIILLWVKITFGKFEALFSLLFLITSQWLMPFGLNLWWSLWSFFLPICSVTYVLYHQKSNRLLLILLSSTLAIKFFFTGYEYITTTILSCFIPIVFYGLINSYIKKDYYSKIKQIIIANTISITCIVTIHVMLIGNSINPLTGINHLIHRLLIRTVGVQNNSQLHIDASYWDVLKIYLNHLCQDFSFIHSYLKINFAQLLILSAIIACFLYFKKTKITKALIITTLVSVVCPLSWYLIFKTHSHVHWHMNSIVWYLPTFLLCPIIISNGLKEIFTQFLKK